MTSRHYGHKDVHSQHGKEHEEQDHSVHDEHNHHDHHNHHEEHGSHGHHDHGDMVKDFRKRFYLSLLVTIPILILSPMIQGFIGVDWQIPYNA